MFWFLHFQGMRVQGWGLGVSMRQEGSAHQVRCVRFQDIVVSSLDTTFLHFVAGQAPSMEIL